MAPYHKLVNIIPRKKHLWNYEFCWTRHKHIVMNLILHSISTSFESLQCQRRIERKSLPNRIQNFDSNVVLRAMVMFRELTLNKVRHCRSTPYELAFMSIIVWKEMYSTYRWQTVNYLKQGWNWIKYQAASFTGSPRFSSPSWKTRRPWGWGWFKPWGTAWGTRFDFLWGAVAFHAVGVGVAVGWVEGFTILSRQQADGMAKSGTAEW